MQILFSVRHNNKKITKIVLLVKTNIRIRIRIRNTNNKKTNQCISKSNQIKSKTYCIKFEITKAANKKKKQIKTPIRKL